MELVTAAKMRERDRWAIEVAGLPGIALMENAGRQVAQLVGKIVGDPAGKKVWIFAGKGNNGGDGLVAGRHLAKAGAAVEVFLLVPREKISGDAAINLNVYRKLGLPLQEITSGAALAELQPRLGEVDLIVDAILGTGVKGPVEGFFAQVIAFLNAGKKPVLAVDLPSGLEADTGACPGPVVKAQDTITFDLPKIGLCLYPGAELAGNLWVAEIGIPPGAPLPENNTFLVTPEKVAAQLQPRPQNSHKGSWGRVLVVAGSCGMSGAAILATKGALRAGAGLATAAVPEGIQPVVAGCVVEAMTRPLPETVAGCLSRKAEAEILKQAAVADAVVMGPGLGTERETVELVRALLPQLQVPVVLDADGLNALVGNSGLLQHLTAPVIITPHPGEMARLCNISVADVQANRLALTQAKAKEWGVILVLKGARTIIAAPDGRTAVNPTGNAGLASGGTGDVLAGVIAALVGQGCAPFWAAVSGVFLHGLAGDLGVKEKGEAGLLAGDVVEYLPSAWLAVTRRMERLIPFLHVLA